MSVFGYSVPLKAIVVFKYKSSKLQFLRFALIFIYVVDIIEEPNVKSHSEFLILNRLKRQKYLNKQNINLISQFILP